jgi:hypothetical protein
LEFNRELHDRINTLEKRCLDFEDLKMDLEHKVLLMDRKLKVFDAFFEGQDSPGVRSMTTTVKRSSGRLDDSAVVFARAGARTPSWSEHLHIPDTEKPGQPREEDGESNTAAMPLRSTSRSDSFLHRLLREKYGQGAVDGKSESTKSVDDTESAVSEKDYGKCNEKAKDGECNVKAKDGECNVKAKDGECNVKAKDGECKCQSEEGTQVGTGTAAGTGRDSGTGTGTGTATGTGKDSGTGTGTGTGIPVAEVRGESAVQDRDKAVPALVPDPSNADTNANAKTVRSEKAAAEH